MLVATIRYTNAALMVTLAVALFWWPVGRVAIDLADPALRGPGVPDVARRLHLDLAPRVETWARDRIASQRGSELSLVNISGTEWPAFGCCFYLWAIESLQTAWEADATLFDEAPEVTARGAIDAAKDLVLDPSTAAWVEKHWGADHMSDENAFYRWLVIAAITSHHNLTGSNEHLDLLREQVETLAATIDASPHGLIDDYPNQCFPGDVVTAIASIRRADAILGTDHSAFAARALRGFTGDAADSLGLPTYFANASKGVPIGTSRGCAMSYICLNAPELWPEAAKRWYDLYEEHFWQRNWSADGFREFPRAVPDRDWYSDVDAGPVLAGHGISACAFGVGAARVNGRFDHAFPLTTEMLVLSWPLPNGMLLGPRSLSNAVDAPLLGESAILYNLTRAPAAGFDAVEGGSIPPFVYVILTLQFAIGLLLVLHAWRIVRRQRRASEWTAEYPGTQFLFWSVFIVLVVVAAALGSMVMALILLLTASLLPRSARTAAPAPD